MNRNAYTSNNTFPNETKVNYLDLTTQLVFIVSRVHSKDKAKPVKSLLYSPQPPLLIFIDFFYITLF